MPSHAADRSAVPEDAVGVVLDPVAHDSAHPRPRHRRDVEITAARPHLIALETQERCLVDCSTGLLPAGPRQYDVYRCGLALGHDTCTDPVPHEVEYFDRHFAGDFGLNCPDHGYQHPGYRSLGPAAAAAGVTIPIPRPPADDTANPG